MKAFVAFVAFSLVPGLVFADGYVRGYTRQDGTYVNGYTRSSPDNSYNNNYSVRGNTNPYTGREGTSSPTYNDRTPDYNTRTYGNPGYTNSNPGGLYGNGGGSSRGIYRGY
ncbi:hypothetical protein [Citrifermentans bremense]|uniref:Uncharacterized protein n=1 Tax=Citrifermentans bremense TaxID=60035 RepID=A0A6S6LXN3_9BACT|nr:hypothetical protein [Citrifermentans bremense]